MMTRIQNRREVKRSFWHFAVPVALLFFACLSPGTQTGGKPSAATGVERACEKVAASGPDAKSAIASIWAVNDGEKINRDDLKSPYKAANSVWNGQRIKLFGARNEVVAFQLIVESGAAGIQKLKVSLPELSQEGGAKIVYRPPVSDPTQYAGRPIQLFSENYMQVTAPTEAGWIYKRNTPSAPQDPMGWKPVQLVPENARPGKGGFPLRVEPSRNQAIWVDIYAARTLPPGSYRGRVRVEADGERREIPVELELFAFTLSDDNSMNAMIYYESVQPELYQGRNLDVVYHRFAHRQRVELVGAYDEASALAALGRFRGSDFTPANGYEGPGEGVGNRLIPASFYGPGKGYDERASAWHKSDAWMGFLKQNFPDAITFLYMPDEPHPSEYAHIRRLADNVHSNPGVGRALPIFVTKGYVKELDDAIDIWCSGPQAYDIERALEERAEGRDYWVYNGGRPYAGAIVIDAPATDPRATIWACFKHGIRTYSYWHGDHWRHNSQKQGERIQNVWANPITFDNRGQPNKPRSSQSFANGDGVLMYPGEERIHKEEDRGIAGPCSTIQLANFRRGLQDHQYLTLARKFGLDEIVARSLEAAVPRVFSDAHSAVGFAEHGDDYERLRYELAKAIARRAAGQR
ncbi:MAG TPA: glycoside hydrolase domain-containing protein [Blastocatellia bacterium]|nr:glycoside hydrolase domain-containing protein [Blastocatellia bacterium]